MMKAATTKKKAPSNKKEGTKTMGEEEPITMDSLPTKKKQQIMPMQLSINHPRGFTVNPYVQETKNKMDLILHEG